MRPQVKLRREDFGEEVSTSEYVFQFPNGARREVRLRIGKPYFISDGEWACPVELNGFEPRYADARGADSLQALGWALLLVRKRFEDFLKRDGKVLHMDGTEYPPDALWAGFGL